MAAAEALATSRQWPVLQEMATQGTYAALLWQYAHAFNGSGTVAAGKALTVEEPYHQALGG